MTTVSIEKKEALDQQLRGKIDRLQDQLNHVLKGKAETVDFVITCLLAQGHLLLEDQPGLGKTTLAKALATGLGSSFARVQCTPDLLPSDVTGFSIFNQKTQEFGFRQGPVFSEVLLADEINRATPRTQSALLEAMGERQVTIDAKCYRLPETFFVIATQNPIEQHGTYPLPEAQLDRFAMKLSIGYPEAADEVSMLNSAIESDPLEKNRELVSVFEPGDLIQLQRIIAGISVSRAVQEYLVEIGKVTRAHSRVHLGLSPRGLLVWQRSAQARAYLQNRTFVTPNDLQQIAEPVLSVRLGVDDPNPEQVIEEIIKAVPVPTIPK